MDFLPPSQLQPAMALQTLVLPSTFLLCFISMVRERSIGHQDEKRLVRLYKQHAYALEVFQFIVSLVAFWLVMGNTLAALEAHSLIVDFASHEATASVLRSALVRNAWLLMSALFNLACISMLDSWALPTSMKDLTDPLFRMTREALAQYISEREANLYPASQEGFFGGAHASFISGPHEVQEPHRERHESPYRSPPKTPSEQTSPTSVLNLAAPSLVPLWPTAQAPPPPPPPATPTPSFSPTRLLVTHPPATRTRYQDQTRASALRASSTSRASTQRPAGKRTRKRSVRFALPLQEGDDDRAQNVFTGDADEKDGLVNRRVREFEETLGLRKKAD